MYYLIKKKKIIKKSINHANSLFQCQNGMKGRVGKCHEEEGNVIENDMSIKTAPHLDTTCWKTLANRQTTAPAQLPLITDETFV